MKNLKYLLLAIPLLLGFTACNDDDKTPAITVYADMYGFYYVENKATLFVVPDDYIVIKSLKAVSGNNTDATIGYASYSLNGEEVFTTSTDPFSFTLSTNKFNPGSNVLTIDMIVKVPGADLTPVLSGYEITAVNSVAELPAGAVYYSATQDKEENQ